MTNLFCKNFGSASSLKNKQMADLDIPWADFMRALDDLKIRMRSEEESEL